WKFFCFNRLWIIVSDRHSASTGGSWWADGLVPRDPPLFSAKFIPNQLLRLLAGADLPLELSFFECPEDSRKQGPRLKPHCLKVIAGQKALGTDLFLGGYFQKRPKILIRIGVAVPCK